MTEYTETTREAVRRVASEILAEGSLPTGREVRSRIGRGSFNTIHSEIELWAKEAAALIQLPEIPSSIKDLVISMWRQSVDAAAVEYLPKLEAQTLLAQESKAQSETLRDELQVALASYQAKLDEALAQSTQAQAHAESLIAYGNEQKAQVSHLEQVVDDLRVQLEQSNKAAADARDFFQEERNKMADQFAAMEDKVMTEADSIKQAAKQSVESVQATLRREQATSAQRQTDSARQIDELKQQLFLQAQRLETITLQNAKYQVDLTQARSSAQHTQQENILLRDSNATLKALIESLQAKSFSAGKDE